jgi:hypothetical protein
METKNLIRSTEKCSNCGHPMTAHTEARDYKSNAVISRLICAHSCGCRLMNT